MSTEAITIKPNNHRVHPCPNSKKFELTNKLILENKSLDIVVVTSVDAKNIKDALENQDIKVMEDKEFITSKDLSCDILISFDVPKKAIIYSARVAKVTQKAYLLLDKSEQKLLYPIEMLLGRAIKQEVLSGFEYEVKEKKMEPKFASRKMSKTQIKDEAKKRNEMATGELKEEKTFDKPKKDFKSDKKPKDNKWEKTKKKPNKFLGKDENGKAIFSGKSGERNHHYDGTPKDKYNAPKKVGRKINIKALKKQEED